MHTTYPIVEIEKLQEYIGKIVCLKGAIHKIRRMRGFSFVILRGPRSTAQCLYIPEYASFSLEALEEEC